MASPSRAGRCVIRRRRSQIFRRRLKPFGGWEGTNSSCDFWSFRADDTIWTIKKTWPRANGVSCTPTSRPNRRWAIWSNRSGRRSASTGCRLFRDFVQLAVADAELDDLLADGLDLEVVEAPIVDSDVFVAKGEAVKLRFQFFVAPKGFGIG